MLRVSTNLRWYHFTRGFGTAITLYGLLLDRSGIRGEIVLGGLGLIGLEPVNRSDKGEK